MNVDGALINSTPYNNYTIIHFIILLL